jgi:hypothetical protein
MKSLRNLKRPHWRFRPMDKDTTVAPKIRNQTAVMDQKEEKNHHKETVSSVLCSSMSY